MLAHARYDYVVGLTEMKGRQKLNRADRDWEYACQSLEQRDVRRAFRLMLRSAQASNLAAQVNVGYLYDVGIGVRRDQDKAVYWYRRAARRGEASAANNIGTVYRDRGQRRLARFWFGRAVSLGNDDAHLELAVLDLNSPGRGKRAKRHLVAVLKSMRVAPATQDRARELLRSSDVFRVTRAVATGKRRRGS